MSENEAPKVKEVPILEVLVGIHHNLGWLEDFGRRSGHDSDDPPHRETFGEIEEYIERVVRRLSTQNNRSKSDGSV